MRQPAPCATEWGRRLKQFLAIPIAIISALSAYKGALAAETLAHSGRVTTLIGAAYIARGNEVIRLNVDSQVVPSDRVFTQRGSVVTITFAECSRTIGAYDMSGSFVIDTQNCTKPMPLEEVSPVRMTALEQVSKPDTSNRNTLAAGGALAATIALLAATDNDDSAKATSP